MDCYCGSLKKYVDCCQLAHHDIQQATSAEQLMRSRYSAFVLANGDYLMRSHHSSTRPLKEKESIVKWAKSVTWLKLEILETTKGQAEDSQGSVTFNAYYMENGKMNHIHEKSAFIKENKIWYYLGFAKD